MSYKLNKNQIKFFTDYSKIPIPTNEPDIFDYYVNLLKNYYDIEKEYSNFVETIKNHENFNEYKKNARNKNDLIIETFKNGGTKYDIVERFKNWNYEKDMILKNEIIVKKQHKQSIYIDENVGKTFLSIDLKSANFSVLQDFDPLLFDNQETWTDFMLNIGYDKFIANSKQFREAFFGQTGLCKKTHKLYKYLIDKGLTYIKNNYDYTDKDVVTISDDEIILKYNGKCPYELHNIFPNKFNIEVFTLIKPVEYFPYFIKRMSGGDKIGLIIKCVPTPFGTCFTRQTLFASKCYLPHFSEPL